MFKELFGTSDSSEDLNHVNFFDEVVCEASDIPNDEMMVAILMVEMDAIFEDGLLIMRVKYGLEKFVNYSKLSYENLCFMTELNKSIEPKSYWQACKNHHWIKAMNKEIGIEVTETYKGLCLSQRKYFLDLLTDFGLLSCKPSDVPLEQKLLVTFETSSSDPILDNIIEY
ncbi:hypothetical protein Tco_0641888 [Tanacetum coccineum]